MRPPAPDWTAEEAISHLRTLASAENRAGMARFGIDTSTALGVGNTTLRQFARRMKRDHARALDLWASGIREARLLAAFTDEPAKVTKEQCRAWAADFNSWEIVDGVADLFVDTPFWRELVDEFADDEREFVRRTAFAMLAWSAVHLKKEPDTTFEDYLRLVERHAGDPRNFVRKAVNWALRQIGKRSMALHAPALALAQKLAASADRTERWIGKDAAKELSDPKVLDRLGKRGPASR
jgi:3-methyladenine DNA glycosylase AlkD